MKHKDLMLRCIFVTGLTIVAVPAPAQQREVPSQAVQRIQKLAGAHWPLAEPYNLKSTLRQAVYL